MKHHNQFRTALLVSIQERQAQYPEMTDSDFERALRTLADQSERDRARRRRAEDDAHWQARMAEIRQRRDAENPNLTVLQQERLEAQRKRQEQIRQQQEQNRRQFEQERAEREAQRKLSLRMIDAGYKTLAKELHPDKGGPPEVMSRLNRARAHQKRMS